jgi:hypothetical protein
MQPLSKEAEQKLIGAIERAAGYVNDGMAPNDAIVKSASESNIPAGHINLMVHAYNTGRTTKQREQGEGTLEKAADFQLADVDIVRDRLFPKDVKTAAQIERAHVVSTDYAVSPTGMLQRRKAAMAKEAAAAVALPEKTWAPPPRDEQAAARKAASAKRAAELAAEEVRRHATVAHAKAAAAMEELHEYFRHPGNVSFQDAVRETELRLGADGVNVLKKLAAVYPLLEKQAATKQLFLGGCDPVTLVSKVLDAVETYNETRQKLASTAVKQAAFCNKKAPEITTESILYNPADEPLTLKGASDDKPSGFFGGLTAAPKAIGQTLSGVMPFAKPKEPGDFKADAFKSLTDPAHENELRSIRSQGALHDLIVNDPVISGHDPHEVAMAFNELADLSPNFVDSPAMMQALLRKRLEAGQMADFDIKQLADIEKARADADKARTETLVAQKELI